ncbi:hypothetical protein YC2023_068637 [Brassica napus]
MGGYFTKRMFLQLLTLIMLLPLLISSSSGKYQSFNSFASTSFVILHQTPSETEYLRCASVEEGRFQPSESEGNLPKFSDLNLCNEFHGKTSCSASRMLSAVQNLSTYGEAPKDCLYLFELLECSKTLPICASFCDRVFEACSDAYFTSDASDQVIVPCGASESIICGKASKWETNGTAFCYALGFTVQSADEEPCYGSKSSLEPPLVVEEEPLVKTAWFQSLQIYWLVIVIVLRTVCWLEIRGRYQRQMRGLIQRERVVRNMNGIVA